MTGAGAKSKKDGLLYTSRTLLELPFQLFQFGGRSRVDEFLLAPNWMQQKLNAFGPNALVSDYEDFGHG